MSGAKLSSRRVYSGKVFNVDLDRVRFPDGSEGELEIIRHPGASAILPFLSDPAGDDPQILSRALGMIERGEIKDAKTALSILYAAGFRAGR